MYYKLLMITAVALLTQNQVVSQISAPIGTPIDLPRQSQKAIIMQRIGLTDVSIEYSRPKLNGRAFPDDFLRDGQVWRAGANENTVITLSTRTSINDKKIDKGKYGLHILKEEDAWVVILSNTTTDWGSFTYDEKEDAYRISVNTEQTNCKKEFLEFGFDNITENSATIYLDWGDIRIPMSLSLNTHDLVIEKAIQDIRSTAGAGWQGQFLAGAYIVNHQLKNHYDKAESWLNTSTNRNGNYNNLMVLSNLYSLKEDGQKAKSYEEKALQAANAMQLGNHAYGLMGPNKNQNREKALEILNLSNKKFPEQMVSHANLAVWYMSKPDRSTKDVKKAIKFYESAIVLGKDTFPGYAQLLRKRVDELSRKYLNQ